MNLVEMQILFHQIIEDTNPEFWGSQRPVSFNVVNYLNQAVMRYVQKKYLPFSTIEENAKFISQNSNDIINLIHTVKTSQKPGFYFDEMNDGLGSVAVMDTEQTQGPFFNNIIQYVLPQDYLHYIKFYVKTRRENASVLPTTGVQHWQECKIISQDKIGRFMVNEFNRPIIREPVVLFETDNIISIIHDGDQTALLEVQLVYLRKPDTLSFDFTWMDGTAGTDFLDSSMIGQFVRVKKGSLFHYPVVHFPIGGFRAGQKFKVFDGYYKVYPQNTYYGIVGYPGNETDELSLSANTHEDIVRLAVQMFLDEAKFKLLEKAQA